MKKQTKYYLIYQITNNLNHKIYIGKHKTNCLDDDYFGSGKHLKRAQEKYGLENFTKTILFYCANEEEMNLLEKMIVTTEFCTRKDVYNINIGGYGGWTYCNSNGKRVSIENQKKDIQKMVEHRQNTISNWSEEKRAEVSKKLSNAMKHHIKEFGPIWLGRHHTIETRKTMSISHQGKHDGKLNSQFGTMWICNDLTRESKKILKTDSIPEDWRKGRICKK